MSRSVLRILANENFPGPLIRELRQRGHDVVSVKESMRGATDRQVLERAQKEERLVITFDKDFGARLPLRASGQQRSHSLSSVGIQP